jgi:hypothetical protein
MKTKTPVQIFVDDGYPEASDYDNNFVRYDPSVRGSCERALIEARLRSQSLTKQRRYSGVCVFSATSFPSF